MRKIAYCSAGLLSTGRSQIPEDPAGGFGSRVTGDHALGVPSSLPHDGCDGRVGASHAHGHADAAQASGVSVAEAGVAGGLVDAPRDRAVRAGKGSHSMSGNGPYEKNAVPDAAAGRPSRLRGGPGLAGGRALAGSGERNSRHTVSVSLRVAATGRAGRPTVITALCERRGRPGRGEAAGNLSVGDGQNSVYLMEWCVLLGREENCEAVAAVFVTGAGPVKRRKTVCTYVQHGVRRSGSVRNLPCYEVRDL